MAAATYFVAKLGCTAFPVWGSADGKCFCGDPHDGLGKHQSPDNVGKHPGTAHGFQDATADLDRIRTFLHNPGTPNYGLNAPEGVLAIDVDGEGLRRWEELQTAYGPLPITLTTITANGRHYFFRWPESVGPMPKGKMFGFVVRRHDDGYVIGPGSVHPSGFTYDTLRRPSGHPYDIAELPVRWAEAALKPPVVIGPKPLPEKGQRHDWLRDRARHLRGFIDEPAVLEAALLAENARLSAPKTRAEVERAIGDVFEKFPLDPPEVVEEKIARKLGDDELGLLPARAASAFPDPAHPLAFEGLLGECVMDIAPGTDAALVGLLGSLVAFCGALIPGQAYFHRLQSSSPFIALVGESSVGRKGTAMMRAKDAVSSAIEPIYVNRVILDGLNSGEGLISALHYKREAFPHEPTVGLVFEEEYASLLASRGREGSTLDPKMRAAFDGGPLSNRRSGESKTVIPPYWLPALIAITPDELRLRLEAGSLQSGSANRWLYLAVRKRDVVPTNDEPRLSREHRRDLVAARRWAIETTRTLAVDPRVTATLAEYADFLPGVSHGAARDLVRRLSVIAFRVALIHALVARAATVTPTHLGRALALTEYARQGIPWVFGEVVGSLDADLLLRNLTEAGRLTKNTITRGILRDPLRQQAAIDELVRLNRARVVTTHPEGGGRPRTELVLIPGEGSFVHFVQGFATAQTENTENVDEMDETPDLSTNGLDETRTKRGENLDETGRNSWVEPCRDYASHQSGHRLTPAGWVCDLCRVGRNVDETRGRNVDETPGD